MEGIEDKCYQLMFEASRYVIYFPFHAAHFNNYSQRVQDIINGDYNIDGYKTKEVQNPIIGECV